MLVALLFELAYVLYFRFTQWKSGGKATGGRLLSVSKRPSSSKLDLTALDDDAELGRKSEDPLKYFLSILYSCPPVYVCVEDVSQLFPRFDFSCFLECSIGLQDKGTRGTVG